MRLEMHALVRQLADSPKREHLKASRIRENRFVPSDESMNAAGLLDHFFARLQMQVIGIA